MTAHGERPRFGHGDVTVVSTLLVASIVQSLPPLLNAAGTQSDAAVVGLQAMHALRGEASWFLWGSGYQTSVDSWLAAAFFRMFGATPLVLMLSSFVGYLVLTGFAYATLRRRFPPWSAALLVAPLVLMAPPVHIYAFYPPRQASLTLFFAALCTLDGATTARRVALGALLAGLACFADPYALLFLPAAVVFLVLLTRDRRLLAVGAVALVVGLVPFWLLSHSAGARHGVFQLDSASFGRHVKLLFGECLPYLLGTEVKQFVPGTGYVVWQPPRPFRVVEMLGACSLIAGIVVGGVIALRRRDVLDARRLGVAGAVMLPITLAAFSVSVMAMDRLSARYLVAIVLMAPFALAPVLRVAGRRTVLVMLAPYLVSIAVGGWLGYGDNVDGARIRTENGRAEDERQLVEALHARGLRYGYADYWVSYRLTFLFHEDPILVPWHAALDRYPPYRRAVKSERTVAYVFDPYWSQEDLAYRKSELATGKVGFEPGFDEFRAGRYTVLVLRQDQPGDVRVAGAHGGPVVASPLL
ncbi:MAG TPA: hypothetical protein VH062_25475 [Polyangiaceae bacterium]|jgi:hypothetical protein|nr:hypothetical protein [Polyangiaceae bacterium]